MTRIYLIFQRTEAGWRQMPDVFHGAARLADARAKLAEYAGKYGKDNVALRFVQLAR